MNKPTRAAGEERNRPTRKSPAVSSAAVPSQPSVHPQCLWVSSRAFILNRNPEIVFLIFISMYLDLVGACIITSLRCRNRLTPTRVRHPRRSIYQSSDFLDKIDFANIFDIEFFN